jgi:hypothetical protein
MDKNFLDYKKKKKKKLHNNLVIFNPIHYLLANYQNICQAVIQLNDFAVQNGFSLSSWF